MKNPKFLGKIDGFDVKKAGDSIIISENFKAPSHDNFQGKREFDINIKVNLEKRPTDEYIEVFSRKISAKSKINDANSIGSGYPWNKLHQWENKEGESLLKWISRLRGSELVRPTESDRLGGESPYENALKKQNKDVE